MRPKPDASSYYRKLNQSEAKKAEIKKFEEAQKAIREKLGMKKI